MIFIDADILCVRPFGDLVARADEGAILAFEDIGRPGFSDELWAVWGRRLSLGPLEPGPYLNSGFLALSRRIGVRFFQDIETALELVDPLETYIHSPDGDVRRAVFLRRSGRRQRAPRERSIP